MKTDLNGTREHILDTGYSLIACKGFSNVGLAEILKSAHVPKGSFYYYFKSKEQFGEELIRNYFDEYLSDVNLLFNAEGMPAYERLINYWQQWLDTQAHGCDKQRCLVVKLSAEIADLSEPMRLVLLDGSKKVVESIARCIVEGVRDGSIPDMDVRYIAEILYNMWLGASLISKLHRNGKALQQVMQMTKTILTGKITS